MNPLEYALQLAEKEVKKVKQNRDLHMEIVSNPKPIHLEYMAEYEEQLDKYNKLYRDAQAMVNKLINLIEEGH